MNKAWSKRAAGIFFLGITLLLIHGCGFKTTPIPPQGVVPEAITDLFYQVNDKGVQLSWSYPVRTIKGSALDNISSFQLYRAEVSLQDYCGSCPIPFGEPMELDGGSPVDGKVRRKAGFESSLMRPGYKYFFKVRSRTSWWADSGDSNIISFVWFQPAAAPEDVIATPGDGQVSLKWPAVTLLSDGTAVEKAMKYQVFRSVDGKDYERLGEPVPTPEYVDRQVRNGLKYFYTIQSMMVFEDELVNGGISKDVAVTPVDLTPPASPTGVAVVRTAVGIKVFWEKSNAADTGGYRIYRRTADKDNYELLGEVGTDYMLYVDRKAGDRVRYYYAVTAIDQATPPNESNKSKEATVRY